MKAKVSTKEASKKTPNTGSGDKGIATFIKGKPDAKAAFVKLGTNQKFAVGTKNSKKK